MSSAKYSGGGAGAPGSAWATVEVGASALARAWAYGVTLAGVGVILWLPAPAVVRAGLACGVLVAALRSACREGCRAAGPVRVSLSPAGEVTVEHPGRPPVSGSLHPGSIVFTRLVVIRYQPATSRLTRALLVLPDATDQASFRRLRVLLRAR